ncbi:MAG TPA: 5'/3'-nucleotidase SurE [Aggregatilineales bacterium]|nr:5'/3'-nucleotidase SurE [Anaerolineales bacterium]HRE48026.1 5'/3'-nucleotidase SurE [Aggregatilineales bacterium]
MHILVSNDDGIFAPGLLALATIMQEFGRVTVIGPEENQSANGHRKTLTKPLRATPVKLGVGFDAYSIDGAPADCVSLAFLGLISTPVDMIVSGINRGTNLGQDLTYSGTVAAAFEGTIHGKPSVAFSYQDRSLEADYTAAAEWAKRIVTHVIQQGLPRMTLLNVNIPHLSLAEIKGVQVTRQGTSIYHDELVTRLDPSGRPYYWIGGEAPTGDISQEGTDIWAVHHGYVSVTPIHLDMTAHTMMDTLKGWGL